MSNTSTETKERKDYTLKDLQQAIVKLGGNEYSEEEVVHAAIQVMNKQEEYLEQSRNQMRPMYIGMVASGIVQRSRMQPEAVASEAIAVADAIIKATAKQIK